jgi:hypothetical protein
VVEPGTGDFVVIKPRQAKGVSSHPDSSTNEERQPIDEQQVGTDPADSYLFSCPEDGCIKSYMTHGRLQQHLMYGRHNFRQNQNVPLLDRAKISYADRLEEERGGQSLITMTGSTKVGTTSVSEGWAGRDPKRTGHRFSAKQRTFLENKFNDGVKTGVKANPDNVSKEMRQLKDQNGKRVFTVVEFLRPQQISSFFSRMASKRKGATESDDEAEEFTRHQAAVNSNVLETLKQDVAHPVLFSGKSLCQMTREEIGNLKITQLRSMTSHFGISVKGRAKAVYSDAMIAYLNRCSCKHIHN